MDTAPPPPLPAHFQRRRDLVGSVSRQMRQQLFRLRLRRFLKHDSSLSMARRRMEAIRELISTEKLYYRQMHTMVQVFLNPLQRDPTIIDQETVRILFSNAEQIEDISKHIRCDLELEMNKFPNGNVSSVLLRLSPYLKVCSIHTAAFFLLPLDTSHMT